ncbi:MAG: LCP family protein [Patescibacteria group bacterium]
MFRQINFNSQEYQFHKRPWLRVAGLMLVLILAISAANYFAQLSARKAIVVDSQPSTAKNTRGSLWSSIARALPIAKDITDDPQYVLPKAEPNRTDILILGVRGKEDPDGGLLSDTMMLLSFDKATNHASLVSIPRDLYIRINSKHSGRVNTAYEYLGLKGTRLLLSRVTGVYIDNIVIFDFEAFQHIVDAVDGIDVTLEKPFEETTQWGYTFSLPAGQNHLDGQTALYYVRSRYSTSDFDRARRQQQVIIALKNKIQSLNLLTNPVRALEMVTAIKSDVTTDIDIFDINSLLDLAQNLSPATIRREVITTDNLLYDTYINGAYVLLPKGDSFSELKKLFKDSLL